MPGPQSNRSRKTSQTGQSTNASRGERAFLVGLDYRKRTAQGKSSPIDGRMMSGRKGKESSANSASSKAPPIPEFTAEESLNELRSLAASAGAEIAGEFLQRRDRPDAATLIGKGKLEEIAGAAASVSANLLLFDHDLTASQQRNIEKVVGIRVIDRTQLILDIFAKHARTREGQLQVELAQLDYMLPRSNRSRQSRCPNLGAELGREAQEKLSSKPTAEKSSAGFVT